MPYIPLNAGSYNCEAAVLWLHFSCSALRTPNDINNLEEEVLKMKYFKHPNVMSLIGVCENFCGGPSVVMPFMSNGSVLDYLKRERKSLVLDAEEEKSTVCIIMWSNNLDPLQCIGISNASLPNTALCFLAHLYVAYNDVFQSTYILHGPTLSIMCCILTTIITYCCVMYYRFLVFSLFSWECVYKLLREWST